MLMAKACKTIKKYYMDCQCYILIKHIYSVCRFKQEILKRRISPNDGPSKNHLWGRPVRTDYLQLKI